jgi:hypothetical protein
MGDKTVFQQQARMQSAQLEQNQQLMAQNAQQINLLQKAQDDVDEAKRIANELFEGGRRTKKLTKIFEEHKELGFVLCQSEQLRWKEKGLNGSALADISSKERFDKMQTEIEGLLEDDSNEPDDLGEILDALSKARSITGAIGGHNVDTLEQAKEQWAVDTVEDSKKVWSLKEMGWGIIIAITIGFCFLAFLLPLWLGFVALVVIWRLVRGFILVSSTKTRVNNELTAYKANCQQYRGWKADRTGEGYLKDYFSDSSAAFKLVMEHYTL